MLLQSCQFDVVLSAMQFNENLMTVCHFQYQHQYGTLHFAYHGIITVTNGGKHTYRKTLYTNTITSM